MRLFNQSSFAGGAERSRVLQWIIHHASVRLSKLTAVRVQLPAPASA